MGLFEVRRQTLERVIVTVGPRGSGKSTYCQKAAAANRQRLTWRGHRNFLSSTLGETTLLTHFSGAYAARREQMWRRATAVLCQEESRSILILDCWNETPSDRREIIHRLRHQFDVKTVDAWYFITSSSDTIGWYLSRQPSLYQAECVSKKGKRLWREVEALLHHHSRFHEQASGIDDEEGFDSVIRINPTQLLLPEMQYL